MASTRDLRLLHRLGPTPTPVSGETFAPRTRADFPPGYPSSGSGQPYDAGSSGRRMTSFNPSRLGPSSSLYGSHDLMLARCHDEVRNNPWAASAVDNFESQIVGNGIKPKWNLKNDKLKEQIEREFHLWAASRFSDQAGLLNYYGLQALAAREIFEGGEVFVRRHIRAPKWRPRPGTRPLRVPLQIQLIESEQVPIWLNISATTPGPIGTPAGNVVRTGKEYDKDQRLVAFHMFAEHPGETMFFPSTAIRFVRVGSEDVLHAYKPFRAGLLRGQPHLASTLVLLHELTKYTDATVVAKQIQAMFAGFIKKVTPESDLLPPDPSFPAGVVSPYAPQGTRVANIEPGSLTELFPGEDITFPNLPQNSDMAAFMGIMLHQFAVAIGATYEQVTGDLRGVNLSSIRSGVQDAHRKCEQFIYNVAVTQFCEPIVHWWLDEAVLSGRLRLPGYAQEPEQYQDITWNTSGWPWLDPSKDIEAKKAAVRAGFTTRETVCAETGEDASKIDVQRKLECEREDRLEVVYDTRPDKILVGREANPTVPEEGASEAEETEPEDPNADKLDKSGIMRIG